MVANERQHEPGVAHELIEQTDEGTQELRPRNRTTNQELVLTGSLWPDADETMVVNMGPQHPSTHGVLRVMMELDGETVVQAKPVIMEEASFLKNI